MSTAPQATAGPRRLGRVVSEVGKSLSGPWMTQTGLPSNLRGTHREIAAGRKPDGSERSETHRTWRCVSSQDRSRVFRWPTSLASPSAGSGNSREAPTADESETCRGRTRALSRRKAGDRDLSSRAPELADGYDRVSSGAFKRLEDFGTITHHAYAVPSHIRAVDALIFSVDRQDIIGGGDPKIAASNPGKPCCSPVASPR